MAKGRKRFSVAAGLLSLGDALRFSAPEGEYVRREEGERKRLIPAERLLPLKHGIAKMREQSLIFSYIGSLGRALLCTRIRSFATLFFTCGILQTVSYFVGSYLPVLSGGQHNLVFGLALIVLALVCAFERQSVGGILKKSFLYRTVLHPLLGLEDWEITDTAPQEHFWSMLLGGSVLGVLAVALSPILLLGLCLLLVVLVFTLYKPEAGLVLTALLFPFLPGWAGLTLLAVLHLSFLLKATVGKRSLVVSPADLPVLFLMLILALGGGTGHFSWVLILSVYFLGVNLLRTVEWIRRAAAALAIAAGISSLAMMVSRLTENFAPDILRVFPPVADLFTVLAGREGTSVTVMLLPFLFCLTAAGQRGITRFSYLITFVVTLVPLCLSRDAGLWLGAAAGLVLVLILSRRWGLFVTLCAALSGYTAWMILPGRARESVMRFFGVEEEVLLERTHQRAGAWEAFWDSMPWGVGGSASGEEGSVYLRLGIYGGWIALVALGLAVIWFLVRCVRFSGGVSAGGIHPLVLGAMAGVLVWLLCGVTAPMGEREEVFLLFLLLSFPKAARIACGRKEYRQEY